MDAGINICVITPHQDKRRAAFLERLETYIYRQTMQPDSWIVVDHKLPLQTDLTARIKHGCELAVADGADLILIMEDDDWYDEHYIATMATEWDKAGRPEIIGIDSTRYYHIKSQGYVILNHPARSSLMSTGISREGAARMIWPDDDFIFLDIPMWKHLNGHTFSADLAVGIKHGVGNKGGVGHRPNWVQYSQDKDWAMLRKWIGEDSEFYEQYFL